MIGFRLASLVDGLIAPPFRSVWKARKQKLLVPSATRQRKIMLLREVDGRSDLNRQVWTGKGLIKFLPAQHTGAAPGALVQYPFR